MAMSLHHGILLTMRTVFQTAVIYSQRHAARQQWQQNYQWAPSRPSRVSLGRNRCTCLLSNGRETCFRI